MVVTQINCTRRPYKVRSINSAAEISLVEEESRKFPFTVSCTTALTIGELEGYEPEFQKNNEHLPVGHCEVHSPNEHDTLERNYVLQ